LPTFSPRRDDGYGGTHLILASFPTLSNIFAIHFIKSDVRDELDVQGRDRESAAGGGCGWEEVGCHGGCTAQSGGVAAERGC